MKASASAPAPPQAVAFSATEAAEIEGLLAEYDANVGLIGTFQRNLLSQLQDSALLSPHVHSFKSRLKERDRLRDKLRRKLAEAKAKDKEFAIRPENLLVKVNDLAGIRILHLYTRQVPSIDAALRAIFAEQRYKLVEKPFARTWDDENRAFFQQCGIRTLKSPSFYTSVHYVISSFSRTAVTCEIQVRTLMEEVWGEVDHAINYPHESKSFSCREQLKVLARVTSGATRLVDSIMQTHEAEQPDPTIPSPVPATVRKRVQRRTVPSGS